MYSYTVKPYVYNACSYIVKHIGNFSCVQEVEKQYKSIKRGFSTSFEFCKGESLFVPTDFTKIEDWYVRLAGKTEVSKNIQLLFNILCILSPDFL